MYRIFSNYNHQTRDQNSAQQNNIQNFTKKSTSIVYVGNQGNQGNNPFSNTSNPEGKNHSKISHGDLGHYANNSHMQ